MEEIYKYIYQQGVPYPGHVGERCRKIIDWCLKIDPNKRPTCVELLRECFSGDGSEIVIGLSSKKMDSEKDISTIKTLDTEKDLVKVRKSIACS